MVSHLVGGCCVGQLVKDLMPVDLPPTLLFYGTLFILIILEVIALVMIYSYFKLLKSYDSIWKKQKTIEAQAQQEADKITRHAQDQAQEVLNQAQIQAQQMVAQADHFNQASQQRVAQAIEQFIQQQTSRYETVFNEARQQTLEQVTGLSKTLGIQVTEEVRSLSAVFSERMEETQRKAQESLQQTFERAEGEIAQYKQQRMQEVEKGVQDMVQSVTERVLHKSINMKQHEELVLEALDEAKKQKIL